MLAFVEKEEECVISCSKNEKCSFYKVREMNNKIGLINVMVLGIE